jgi:hypothetical protein
MKRTIVLLLSGLFFLSSCTTYTATGAMVGGNLGHVVGSAIGGISGGWRGHHVGSLIGTVGGVIAGAAVGAAVEQSQAQKYEQRQQARYEQERREQAMADDRIVFEGEKPDDPRSRAPRSVSVEALSRKPAVEVRNAQIFDTNDDGVLSAGEQCTVVFEIMNNSSQAIYDIYPFVEEVTTNKHVQVSPNLRVESIAAHNGIRYTATILADKRLKDGEIVVRLGVKVGMREIVSQAQQYTVPTRRH